MFRGNTGDIPHEARVLRSLLKENKMTHRQLAEHVEIPVERIHTLTRGNAPMRLCEAVTIANYFGRSASFFSDRDTKESISSYVKNHEEEAAAFEYIVIALHELQKSFNDARRREETFNLLPRYSIEDGGNTLAAKFAKHETLCVNSIFKNTEFLFYKKSIFLAGDNERLAEAVTRYIHTWWRKGMRLRDARNYITLHPSQIKEETNSKDQAIKEFIEMSQHYFSSESWAYLDYDKDSRKSGNPKSSKHARKRKADSGNALHYYEKIVATFRLNEYYKFIYRLDTLSQNTNTLLEDSLDRRASLIDSRLPIAKTQVDFDKRVFGLTALQAGYKTIPAQPSDTELARFILQTRKFTWYTDGEESIIASDRSTKMFNSMKELAEAMLKASFFTHEANQSAKVQWDKIPKSEEEFKSQLIH